MIKPTQRYEYAIEILSYGYALKIKTFSDMDMPLRLNLLRYGYAVQDGETGNDFNQQEQSNGDEVTNMPVVKMLFLLL